MIPVQSTEVRSVNPNELAACALSAVAALGLTTYGLKQLSGSYRWLPATAIATLAPFVMWGASIYRGESAEGPSLEGKTDNEIIGMINKCQTRQEADQIISSPSGSRKGLVVLNWLERRAELPEAKGERSPLEVIQKWPQDDDRYTGYLEYFEWNKRPTDEPVENKKLGSDIVARLGATEHGCRFLSNRLTFARRLFGSEEQWIEILQVPERREKFNGSQPALRPVWAQMASQEMLPLSEVPGILNWQKDDLARLTGHSLCQAILEEGSVSHRQWRRALIDQVRSTVLTDQAESWAQMASYSRDDLTTLYKATMSVEFARQLVHPKATDAAQTLRFTLGAESRAVDPNDYATWQCFLNKRCRGDAAHIARYGDTQVEVFLRDKESGEILFPDGPTLRFKLTEDDPIVRNRPHPSGVIEGRVQIERAEIQQLEYKPEESITPQTAIGQAEYIGTGRQLAWGHLLYFIKSTRRLEVEWPEHGGLPSVYISYFSEGLADDWAHNLDSKVKSALTHFMKRGALPADLSAADLREILAHNEESWKITELSALAGRQLLELEPTGSTLLEVMHYAVTTKIEQAINSWFALEPYDEWFQIKRCFSENLGRFDPELYQQWFERHRDELATKSPIRDNIPVVMWK